MDNALDGIFNNMNDLTCYGVRRCRAGGGASRADHASITTASSTHATGAGATPLPAFSSAAGSLSGAVFSDIVAYLMSQ